MQSVLAGNFLDRISGAGTGISPSGKVKYCFLDDLLDELEKFFGKPFRSEMRKTLRDEGDPFSKGWAWQESPR